MAMIDPSAPARFRMPQSRVSGLVQPIPELMGLEKTDRVIVFLASRRTWQTIRTVAHSCNLDCKVVIRIMDHCIARKLVEKDQIQTHRVLYRFRSL